MNENNVGYEAEAEELHENLNNYMLTHRSEATMGDLTCKLYVLKETHNVMKSLYSKWCREESLAKFHEECDLKTSSEKYKRLRPSSPIFKGISTAVDIEDGALDNTLGVKYLNSKTRVKTKKIQKQTQSFISLSPVVVAKHSKDAMEISTPSPLKRKLSQSDMLREFDQEAFYGVNKFSRRGLVPWKLI
jgi:hypothetical protein